MISKIASHTLDYIRNCEYGFKEPLSYVALVPVISALVKWVKFAAYEKELNQLGTPKINESQELDKVSRKFEKVCKAHVQGALIQVIALTVFFPGSSSLLSLIAIIGSIHTTIKAVHLGNKTGFSEYNNHGQVIAHEKRMARLLGW